MKQKCMICGEILEPTKENEIAQIAYITRNKLPPSELCTQLVSTLGKCKDGGLHEPTFEPEDRKRMVNTIANFDSEVSKLDNERKKNVELVNKREQIIEQLHQIGDMMRASADNIAESEFEIETILTDYEAISSTKDIEFYRTIVEEIKEENK